MAIIIPALYFVGAAALSLWAAGCAATKPALIPPIPPLPEPPPEPQKKFPKAALDLHDPEDYCEGNGYEAILNNLDSKLFQNQGKSISLGAYLDEVKLESCIDQLFQNPRQAGIVKNFIEEIDSHDGQPGTLSPYDALFARYNLYGIHWKEDWQKEFMGDPSSSTLLQRIRVIGNPLLDTASPQGVSRQSRDLLNSLLFYFQAPPPDNPAQNPFPLLEYYLDQKEPEALANFLPVSLGEFLKSTDEKKSQWFAEAIQTQFPEETTLKNISPFLVSSEINLLTRECFKSNLLASLSLFENFYSQNFKLPYSSIEKVSGESEFFPNLPQDTPFPERQKAIDEFLGEPILELKKRHVAHGQVVARTTLKKYFWVGDTEVFSIESGKPGPTTLVFAPHFHENNPRKMFHWIKDIPLQSGRVILIPEANRTLGLTGGPTNPMNRIFNKALTRDRVDFLVVRRTEYLMGLVEGMIGLHDWGSKGPFYISDIVTDPEGNMGPDHDTKPSPWIPPQVKKIKEIKREVIPEVNSNPSSVDHLAGEVPLQWKVAEFSAQKLDKMTGGSFKFVTSRLSSQDSRRIDNATAYMNFFLKKPAMTFEGNAEKEHGQLHAMVTYTLLLGYGHKVDSSFEKKLKNPHPEMELEFYLGIPVLAVR